MGLVPQRWIANIASDPCTETRLRTPESVASSSRLRLGSAASQGRLRVSPATWATAYAYPLGPQPTMTAVAMSER